MNAITRLKIENFRRLKSLDLEMRPLGVMIGANGSGKSSIFDALTLMEAGYDGHPGALNQTWQRVVTRYIRRFRYNHNRR